jgi:response regulator RpfG family c-di-GMP phosphodiesterase
VSSNYVGATNGALLLLQIDDSPNDRFLVKEAILLTKTPFKYYEADGLHSAMPYFHCRRQNGEPEKYPRPDLVLLDYDLGENNGADFLYWLRVTKNMTSIPVVMFSGSPGRPHVAECYANGANHFLSKPNDLVRLKVIVRSLYLSFAILKRPGPMAMLAEYRQDLRETVPVI